MWLVSIGALQGSKTTFILRRARSGPPQGNAEILPNIGLLLVSRCLSCEIDEGPGQFNEYTQKEGTRTSYVLVKLRQVRRSIGLTTIRIDAMSVLDAPSQTTGSQKCDGAALHMFPHVRRLRFQAIS